MEVVRVITGNWFPRTKLHLKEYDTFLREGTSELSIPKDELTRVWKRLAPSHVRYVGLAVEGRFDHVDADFDGISASYFEDGLLLASVDVTSLNEDVFRLHTFYNEGVLSALGVLFSVGLPAISVHDPKYTDRPTIFLAKSGTEDEVNAFAQKFEDRVHFSVSYQRYRVFYANTMIVVIAPDVDSLFVRHLIEAIVFFREYETRLKNFLNLHREVWSSIESIRAIERLTLQDLPKIRDSLLDYDRDLAIVVARLSQMDQYLDERRLEIDEFEFTKPFRALEAYRFGKLRMSTKYLQELWEQLDSYIESTASIVALMYQEQFQKGMDVQQFVFLLGAVAGIVLLGGMSGSGFVVSELVFFGGVSLMATILCYYGVKLVTTNMRRINSKRLIGGRQLFVNQKGFKRRSLLH